jgi:hypothetical protein
MFEGRRDPSTGELLSRAHGRNKALTETVNFG